LRLPLKATVLASKALARFHLWYPAAMVLAHTPLKDLDVQSVRRLSYALMMANAVHRESALALFREVLQRNATPDAELALLLAEMAARIEQDTTAEELLATAEQSGADAGSVDAASRLRSFVRGRMDGSLAGRMRDEVRALPLAEEDDSVVLVPLSGRYVDLWQLWLQQVRAHVGVRIVAMVMDDAAVETIRDEPDVVSLDVRDFFAWEPNGGLHPRVRGLLWCLRTLALRELVKTGRAVMVLDLDAIPVADVMPMIAALPPSDIVAQKDHSIPMDVERQIGFVLCCGFLLVYPTPASVALLDRLCEATLVERDDQLALNHLIARAGLIGRTQESGTLLFQAAGAQFVCPDPALVSRTLESGAIIRHFQQDGKTVEQLRLALGLA
jgi:hypothetical protein